MSEYMNHSKAAYTVKEASKLLSLSRAFMYRLIDTGEIETIKIGRSRRITSKQLDAFLVAQEERADARTFGPTFGLSPRFRR
jgi:excisionase family DNA binding protein